MIVVSHGRPALLRRALIGIGQLFYRPFELVVVADDAGLAAISDLPFVDQIKTARQETQNISAARNRGVDLAGGEIVAFIDDDAVPEPTWLNHLVSPFADPDCAASTGTVLGRNGISVQWANRAVDDEGRAFPVPEGALPAPLAIKLEGTNMALRREVLAGVGGFDEGFGFYLDETDLAFRLRRAGHATALSPLATVHHGYAESTRRRADRVPLSLREIGTSTALYLRKHAPRDRLQPALDTLRADQASRLAVLRRAGRLDDVTCESLLSGLEHGIASGCDLTLSPPRFPRPAPPFQPLSTTEPPPPLVLSGRWFSRFRLDRAAAARAAQGHSVSLFLLDHTVRAHSVRFTADGVWRQTGGLFGPSRRDQRRLTIWSFRQRIADETQRLAGIRWPSMVEKDQSVVAQDHAPS